ncbi:hypothetical protein L6164_014527 [Bauhinia variegata]|uniref:Uncharacterized protein n=1 Tax=Bauhinia variegata TaxID=167791 RepID=A0ACB9NIB5_BAUVA|nr:hypothetical protein L6164_014527 [Bauhinia variegata]
MENYEGVDDQNSGWFEVKKKHRNISKFSLQSWVGGSSGKDASNSLRTQHSKTKHVENSHGKHRTQLPRAEENFVYNTGSITSSTSVSNEGGEGACNLNSCVTENQKSPPLLISDSHGEQGDIRKIPQNDKPDVVHKIRWGDLEDDGEFTHPHENSVGAGIKFGSIGDVPDAVPCHSSCTKENEMIVTVDADVVSHPIPPVKCKDEIFGDNGKEVKDISLEGMKIPSASNGEKNNAGDVILNFENKNGEGQKKVNNGCLNSDLLSEEDAMMVVSQAPSLIPELSDIKTCEVAQSYCSPSTAVIVSSTEYVGDSPAFAEDIQVPEDGDVDNVLSTSHYMTSVEEDDSNESKERFRQRLWCFLFENLNRSVDELYLLCELECDLEQMKEAILVLEEAASDFKELMYRVREFEEVKKSSQVIDGVPVILKSDHRRPHALSWEVRRMTTSPHRADILSSSLEAFRKIQQERASLQAGDNAENTKSVCQTPESVGNPKKSSRMNDGTHLNKDSMTKPRKHNGASDASQGNPNEERHIIEAENPRKAVLNQNKDNPSESLFPLEVNFPPRENSASFSTTRSKRDLLECEAEKLLPKKDKVPTECIIEKKPRFTDNTRRQIPLPEKEKRNITAGKSMDAWKEKRNWEDILSSPFRVSSRTSYSTGMSRKSTERVRTLHEKLMSPDKKKKTSLDLKKEAEEKHARAMRIRSELENERVQKLQRTSEKLNRVNELQAVRNMKLREGMYARHQRSESRHEAFLAQVVKRAGDESSKVNEVRFITSLNEENKKLMLRQKLHESELRRAEKLQVIKTKQKEDLAREEAVLERRKLIEAEKLQRLAEMQRKKEEAQARREEERKASSAAREARAIEQLRRKEERAKAQQEEAELLAQKLAERLSESEQRRKIYLEQIRERASMDFRDQSSPLTRRSLNKEGQGRSTPINSNDDSQANIAYSVGGSGLGIGNITLQHSMKRRIKKIRQRLMALKYEFPEPPVGGENAGLGYRVAVGAARAKIGRWLQELQRLRQARKEGAASIGLIIAEMMKYLDGKDPELQASRQAGLLDFIASALPASHTSKPEACQVISHLLKLLRVVLSAPANRSYFLAQNLLPPIIPMLSAALENYIKIAASLNSPGNSLPSNKASVENFESISEILNNYLWIVATIFGHISSEERQLQMRDSLLELLISYQVIHRLRDLFALHDRPQMEGSTFPAPILLSIRLLVVLISKPETISSINWEFSPLEMGQKIDDEGFKISDSANSVISNSLGDWRPPLSVTNGSSVVHLPDVPEDRPLDELCKVNGSDETLPIGKDCELEKTDISVELKNNDMEKMDVLDESKKSLSGDIANSSILQKDVKQKVITGTVHKNKRISISDQPVVLLLCAVSETGLIGLPSLLTAVLLRATNRSSSEQGSFILPSNFEEVATGVLKVLNNVALLDLVFLQQMLGRPDLKMEFFHLMSFLLSHCSSKWKTPNDQVGLLMLESLSLLGHFALFHPGNQAVLRWGKSPTILHKVCDLPFVFFSDPDLMPILAGTLVAACYGCEQNKLVVQQELSVDMLLSLLRSCRTAASAPQLNSASDNSAVDESSESSQLGPEFRKSQVDISIKYGRSNGKGIRASLGKSGASGNSTKNSKSRSQRDSKVTKNGEEMAPKQYPSISSSLMLHCRFPNSFIDKVEHFFSTGILNGVDEGPCSNVVNPC